MADPAYMHAAALAANHSQPFGNHQHYQPTPRPRTLLSNKSRSRSPSSRSWSVKADPRTSKISSQGLVRTSSLSPSRSRTQSTSSPGRRLPQTPENHSSSVKRGSNASGQGNCSKRLEATLTKFSQTALPFHLDVIQQRQANIEKLQACGDWEGVSCEVDEAARAVQQLGTLLFEMEILRTYLEQPAELYFFDSILEPAKTTAFIAVQGLVEMCPSQSKSGQAKDPTNGHRRSISDGSQPTRGQFARRHSDSETLKLTLNHQSPPAAESSSNSFPSSSHNSGPSSSMGLRRRVATSCATGLEVSNSNLEKRPSFGRLQSCGGTLEVLYEDPKEDVASILSGGLDDDDRRRLLANEETNQELKTRESFLKLEEELRDLHELITTFSASPAVTARTEASKRPLDTESPETNSQLSSSAIYPVAGALLGTCLGGPVGLLAGVKIGGLAAIGGSVFGYSTGSIIKQQLDRQEYIDEFYAQHSGATCSRTQSTRGGKSAAAPEVSRSNSLKQRAHSLPDVLDTQDEPNCDQQQTNPMTDVHQSDQQTTDPQSTWFHSGSIVSQNAAVMEQSSSDVTRPTFTTLQSPRSSIGASPILFRDHRFGMTQRNGSPTFRSQSPQHYQPMTPPRSPLILHPSRMNGSSVTGISTQLRHTSLTPTNNNGYGNHYNNHIQSYSNPQQDMELAAARRRLQARSADNLLL